MDPENGDGGGLTVLEGAFLGVATVLLAALLLHAPAAPAASPAGLVSSTIEETDGCQVLSGDVYGYALVNGSIDMSRAAVVVATRDGTERLGRTGETPVRPGNWMIVRTGHMVPFRQADDDTLLEPGERFDLLVYPSRPLPLGEEFRISIIPPGGVPLVVERAVPPRITPVMNLG